MTREHLLKIGRLEIGECYAIITANHGVEIDVHDVTELCEVLQSTYRDRPFGIITNRKNQYSVDPLAVRKLFEMRSLIAGAIVGYSTVTETVSLAEAKLYRTAPVRYFNNLGQAKSWISETVKKAV